MGGSLEHLHCFEWCLTLRSRSRKLGRWFRLVGFLGVKRSGVELCFVGVSMGAFNFLDGGSLSESLSVSFVLLVPKPGATLTEKFLFLSSLLEAEI